MRRTVRFVTPSGTAICRLPEGREILLPVVQGILKHLSAADLARLLEDPAVARKYTREALRVAPWSALREFPADWLRECLPKARVREARIRAIEFLLSAGDPAN
ncbi:MAG: hypothetical protein MUE73_08395 [Planctomycetes bacterium]|nr:hypothetical protein [Planctomycetota bacterium]